MKFNSRRHGTGTLVQFTADAGNIVGINKGTFLIMLDNPNPDYALREVWNLTDNKLSTWHPFNLEKFCEVLVVLSE